MRPHMTQSRERNDIERPKGKKTNRLNRTARRKCTADYTGKVAASMPRRNGHDEVATSKDRHRKEMTKKSSLCPTKLWW